MRKYVILKSDSKTFMERTVYRIKSLVDRPEINVRKGDLGGYVCGYHNLRKSAWVADNAIVCENAIATDNAHIAGASIVRGSALIRGAAKVADNASISGEAKIADRARVNSNARIDGKAYVAGHARVAGNSRVTDSATVCGDAYLRDNVIIRGSAYIDGLVHLEGRVIVGKTARLTGFIELHSNENLSVDEHITRREQIMFIEKLDGYTLTITPKHIRVADCIVTASEWNKLSDDTIFAMGGERMIQWFKLYRYMVAMLHLVVLKYA